MTIFEAVILGIVEGITEFLPISSTGHLILTSHIFSIPPTDFIKSFEIVIQLGAIASVGFLYWKLLLKKTILIKKIIIAFIPTAVLGFIFYPIIKTILLGNTTVVLVALFAGGIALIAFERWVRLHSMQGQEMDALSTKQALIIGVVQSVAFIPGVSRAAATIIGGIVMGLNRKAAVEFSFLLAIPTMLGATGLDLIQNATTFSQYDFILLAIGFMSAFIVAIFAIRFFIKFIEYHSFVPFGIYRILLSILFFIAFLLP